MPRVKVGPGTTIIQPEVDGPTYTFAEGQIAEINNPAEFARVANLPGFQVMDNVAKPPPPPIPRRGPGRPRKFSI